VSRIIPKKYQNPEDVGSRVVDMTTSNVVMGSYNVEVRTMGESRWASNAIRFTTEQEAKEAGADLARRWTMVQDWRVAQTTDKPNYKWKNGRAIKIDD
jgi:hypothetical protein